MLSKLANNSKTLSPACKTIRTTPVNKLCCACIQAFKLLVMQKGNCQHMVMDNVIVVSDGNEDEAKDVVNGDSNSESKVL